MLTSANSIPPIPSETARTARAVFGGTNFYIQLGEQMDRILTGADLEQLSRLGKSLQTAAAILPLVTFFQFIEGLTDEQAADAFRVRMDWKYALHLPVHVPPISEQSLCRFRHKVMLSPACQQEFQALVDRLLALDPPTRYTHEECRALPQLLAICSRNCLDHARQVMSQAIESLAVRFPAELQRMALPYWYGRYNRLPFGCGAGAALHSQDLSLGEIRKDIRYLLAEVERSQVFGLQDLREIQALRQARERWNGGPAMESDEHLSDEKLASCNCCICKMGGGNNEDTLHA